MDWYFWWLLDQIKALPQAILSVLPHETEIRNGCLSDSFVSVWCEVARVLKSEENPSIDTVIDHLASDEIISLSMQKDSRRLARSLVFAIIGWQTMLYRPDCGSCSTAEVMIADDMCGYQGQAHMALKQPESCCKRPLYEFLIGFGMLLPPLNFYGQASSEHLKAFHDIKTVGPATLNASLLTCLGQVNLKWTDSLACHLELDTASNTLYLFRYPTFCVANLCEKGFQRTDGAVLHACAKPSIAKSQWATSDDISHMLLETLASYRLLFGQSKPARQLFRSLAPFEGIPPEGHDALLTELCGRKNCKKLSECYDRDNYDLIHDFPVLRCRISTLQYHLSTLKPRTWNELWQDKRDSAQWFTFWTVLILGGSGVLLSFLQVILQILQISMRT